MPSREIFSFASSIGPALGFFSFIDWESGSCLRADPKQPTESLMHQTAHIYVSAIACFAGLAIQCFASLPDANSSPPNDSVGLQASGTGKSIDERAFDFSNWKLTLPTNSEGRYEGHPVEVSSAELASGFTDPHFQFDASGSIVFWCPVNGAATEGTEFPRSELREMLDPNASSINWTCKGTHMLKAQCRVLQVPSNPKVIIGQIHSYSGKARPLVKLQYFKGRIEALVKSSPTKGKDVKLTWPDVGLKTDIEYEIKVQDDVLSLTVNGATQTQNLKENDPNWLEQTFYFKAGVYPQDNKGPATEGARVSFSHLRVSHESD